MTMCHADFFTSFVHFSFLFFIYIFKPHTLTNCLKGFFFFFIGCFHVPTEILHVIVIVKTNFNFLFYFLFIFTKTAKKTNFFFSFTSTVKLLIHFAYWYDTVRHFGKINGPFGICKLLSFRLSDFIETLDKRKTQMTCHAMFIV